jgi:dynein assembly factor 1
MPDNEINFYAGLSNCTLLKELNLSGNKICEVEGLHRLLKLSVLDLSFNKLPTSKALSQLSANYRSVLAINLIGNPVMSSLGDDSMRKLIVTLLPHVMYLNRNLIKAGSARETVVDSVAKTVLGCLSKPNGKLSGKKLPGKQVDVGTSKYNSKNVKRKPRSVSASDRVVGQQHLSRYRHHHHSFSQESHH